MAANICIGGIMQPISLQKSRIYELEKKHIKEEDRLKKDMMAKLESVASEFRKASHAQMSATTQRTIRENVVTQSEVSSF